MLEDQRDHIQSIERCIEVFDAYRASKQRYMTLSEVARLTSLSKPAVRRILITLQNLGYVASDDSRFCLTPKVLNFGLAYFSSFNLTDMSTPIMESLTDEIGQSSALVALDGTEIVYLNRVHRHRVNSISLLVGTRLPAYATSSGHVLLSGLSEEGLTKYFESADLKQLTEHTLTTRDKVAKRLKLVRARGWDVSDQELEQGRRSGAAPIYDATAQVVAALSFSCNSAEYSMERLVEEMIPRVLVAASEISRNLGGRAKRP